MTHHRNFGHSRRPETPCGEVLATLATLVFAVAMFAICAGALFGGVYVQHKLRSWGWHV